MICIIEPTYARHDHAAVNAALIQAVALACPGEAILFAATALHRGFVEQFGPLPPGTQFCDIDVPPPGGVHFRRFMAQWKAIRLAIRRRRPRAIILLSSGPETFFAARAIVAEFAAVRLFVVLHGNLIDATGWRSRDPRHRPFDYRSGLAAARHPRIRMVVLEDYIRTAAIALGIMPAESLSTWPHPLNSSEIDESDRPLAAGRPVRIAFVGAATHSKGFDKFLALIRTMARQPAGSRYEFRFIGASIEEFPEAAGLVAVPTESLPRDAFIRELRDVDYVMLPFATDDYELTASGSLLDCVSQAKPVISLDIAAVRMLAEGYGDIGFVCSTMTDVEALLASEQGLTDPQPYRVFQSRLRAIGTLRTPAGIAPLIRRDLAA
jgi:hypothetical protein